jgi:hypothetical protein
MVCAINIYTYPDIEEYNNAADMLEGHAMLIDLYGDIYFVSLHADLSDLNMPFIN